MFHSNLVTILPRLTFGLSPDEATATIGPEGGRIALAHAGLAITFPEGALETPQTITVTAHPTLVGFAVHPHLALLKPVQVVQELDPEHPADASGFAFAHVANPHTHSHSEAIVDELIAGSIVTCKSGCRKVLALVKHFSGYLLASGINQGESCDPTVVTDGSCIWVDDGGEQPR